MLYSVVTIDVNVPSTGTLMTLAVLEKNIMPPLIINTLNNKNSPVIISNKRVKGGHQRKFRKGDFQKIKMNTIFFFKMHSS